MGSGRKRSFEVFDRYADRYDSWYTRHRITAENEAMCLKSLGLRGLGVDIGAGTGFFTKILGAIALEPSRQMLCKAKEKGLESIRGVSEYIPVRSNILDYAVMVVTLCFLEDPMEALRETWRVLKNGGVLALCIVPKDSKWGRFYESKKAESPFYRMAKFYTVEEVIGMLRDTGFKVESIRATLSYGPLDEARVENPVEVYSDRSFVCISARKTVSEHSPLRRTSEPSRG